jgi:hypothetical protein
LVKQEVQRVSLYDFAAQSLALGKADVLSLRAEIGLEFGIGHRRLEHCGHGLDPARLCVPTNTW